MKMHKSIKIVFWIHFIFALATHIIIPLMFLGMIRIILNYSDLHFLDASLLIGSGLFSLTYIVNHINNHKTGYCFLTDLENRLRDKHHGKFTRVGRFTPRFYKKIKEIIKGDFKNIPS